MSGWVLKEMSERVSGDKMHRLQWHEILAPGSESRMLWSVVLRLRMDGETCCLL